MRKLTTATTKAINRLQRLTIGLDLGDRSSYYCVLDESGCIVAESKIATSPKAVEGVFGGMARSRIALETGMHSPWVSRLLSQLSRQALESEVKCCYQAISLIDSPTSHPTLTATPQSIETLRDALPAEPKPSM